MAIDCLGRMGSHNGEDGIGAGTTPNGASSMALALAVVFGACVVFGSCLELQGVGSVTLGIVKDVGLEAAIA